MDNSLQLMPRVINGAEKTPTVLEGTGDPMLDEEIRVFGDRVVQYLEDYRQKCNGLRSNRKFSERQLRNKARKSLEMRIGLDKDGAIDRDSPDVHAKLGLCNGWTAEACDTVAAYMYAMLGESGRRPYVLGPRGKRAENKDAQEVFYAVIDDLLKRGKFLNRLHYLCKEIPYRGTCVLRYEMGTEMHSKLNEQGVFEEETPSPVPVFTVWNLEDIYPTNPGMPESTDQEGVFWTKQVTLQDLEKDEQVFSQREDGMPQMTGKFRNLDQVRKMLGDSSGYTAQVNNSQGVTGTNRDKASVFSQGTLVEYEGALPILRWVRDGLIWWDMMKFFGADVGMIPNPDSKEEMEAWGRKLSRITHWRVSYVQQWNGGAQGSRNGILLQLEPDRHRHQRNTSTVFRYLASLQDFYGESIADIGHHLEDAGDLLFNSDIWTSFFNADPPKIIDMTVAAANGVEDKDLDNLINKRKTIKAKSTTGLRIGDMIQFMHLDVDSTIQSKINFLQLRFQNITGVTAAQMGSGGGARSTGTLGELQLEESKSSLKLNDIVLDAAKRVAAIISHLLGDIVYFMGNEAFCEYAARVSGMPISKIRRILPTIDGIEEEIKVEHPLVAKEDAAVIVTLLLKIAQLMPDVIQDRVQFAEVLMEMSGYPRGHELTGNVKSMDPEDEHQQFAMGNWVDPSMNDDIVAHLQAHMALIEQLANKQQRTEEESNQGTLAIMHLKETMFLIQRIQMAQAMAGPVMAPADGSEPGQPGQPGQGQLAGPMSGGTTNPPASQGASVETNSAPAGKTDVKNEVRSKAHETPKTPK